MRTEVKYVSNKASEAEIAEHLSRCDADFLPALSDRVKVSTYTRKIANYATRFEAWSGNTLVGLVAAYCNDHGKGAAYITSVSVLQAWTGKGIATRLLNQCVEFAKASGMRQVSLEVGRDSTPAIRLYENIGFVAGEVTGAFVTMNLCLEGGKDMTSQRNYNREYQDTEDRKYAYNFDSVLRRYMIRAFEPFMPAGRALELGCFEGGFTELLVPYYRELTVVEASSDLVEAARRRVGPAVRFVASRFEDASLPEGSFDAGFLIHTLEHVDDPTAVLRKVSRWLSGEGRLFIAVPNANAASRQIAVNMGLISHNAAVTEGEFAQGHRRTYAFDTLERDVVAAGLPIFHRGGVFFKPLANFQFDKLMGGDVISEAYLEGCYKLGMQYPDLCASIFVVCGRGAT